MKDSIYNLCILIAAYVLRFFLFFYLATLRVRILRTFSHKPDSQGMIYALWHESLLSILLIKKSLLNTKKHVHVLISKSRDGDLPAKLATILPNFIPMRVPHDNRSKALRSIISIVEKGDIVLITPDGPRGPRRKLKSGIVYAASASKCPVVPVAVQWRNAIFLSSWDRFAFPLPFSSVQITIHQPVYVPYSKPFDRENMALYSQKIEDQLSNNM